MTYSGYDQAGNVTQYRMDMYQGTAYTNYYNYTHARYEGYREATLSGTSTELDPGQTTYQYDVNGNLVGVVDTKDGSKNQTLVNDASGKILQRVQDGKTTRSLIVNGELLGTTGPTVGADDFSPSFRPIDGGNPQASPGSYRIQPGDTLQTIAQQAYGDSRLWFLVAEANGLASDRDLRVGATVTIPNRVSGNHNDYKTFKPYDPGKLIGDTQPTMPVPEADGGGGCGGFGSLILAVVAVVATVFTAGALAPAAFATSAAAAAGTTTALGATLAAGSSVLLGGAGFAASVGIGLAAGAVGSIVSQGVGMAMGMQSKFSWSGVALGGLTTAVSAGVASSFGGAAAIQGTLGQKMLEVAGRAVVSSTISQGISMAVGLQSKFSWSGVAAAGVGAAVGYGIGDTAFRGWNGPGSELTRGVVAGTGAGVVASVLSGGKANYVQIAMDAFGNALGNSVVDSMTGRRLANGPIDLGRDRGLRVIGQDLEIFARSPVGMDDGGYPLAKFRADQQLDRAGLPQSYTGGISAATLPGANYSTADLNDALVSSFTSALSEDRRTSAGMLVASSDKVPPFMEAFGALQKGPSISELVKGEKGTFLYGLKNGRANRSVMDEQPVSGSEIAGALTRDFFVGAKDAVLEVPLMAGDIGKLGFLSGKRLITGNADPFTPWSDTGKFFQNGGRLGEYYAAPVKALGDITGDLFSGKYESAGSGALGMIGGIAAGKFSGSPAGANRTWTLPISVSELRALKEMGLTAGGRRAVVEGFDLGLGLTKVEGNSSSLIDFARSQNARIYSAYRGESTNLFGSAWPGSEVKLQNNLQFVMDRANSIKVNLNGVVDSVADLPAIVERGKLGIGHVSYEKPGGAPIGNVTNWEISQILTSPSYTKKSMFFLNGKQVQLP